MRTEIILGNTGINTYSTYNFQWTMDFIFALTRFLISCEYKRFSNSKILTEFVNI